MIGKLKSLEWEDFGSRGSKAPVWGMASYLVTSWGKSRFEVCESYPGYQGPFIGERFYSSLAEAKSAAQADYERRFSLARC